MVEIMENRIIRDGCVAVLYSPGFGAGWSTWVHTEGFDIKCMYDPEVVQWVLDGKPKNHFDDNYFNTKYDAYFYTGGLSQLEIAWIPLGQKFIIREYDGSEDIETVDSINWYVA
jgi:hypothetical protein